MSTNTTSTSSSSGNGPNQPPSSLTKELPRFWLAGEGFAQLPDPEPGPDRSILEQLGPPPLPKSGFPLVGFLATVYDHVAAQAPRP